MFKFFSRERFGRPQLFAALLLLAFLIQCAWFIAHAPLNQLEAGYIQSGLFMLNGAGPAGDQFRSPVVALAAAIPAQVVIKSRGSHAALVVLSPVEVGDQFSLDRHRWLIRSPFVFAGLLLGASLWYVARRLYGNAAGYIALALYVFTPATVARSSLVGPHSPAAWGAFGVIFTAIAVAHTLYAPREVILWNWKRILLLGVSIALSVGSQFALVLLLPVALVYMLWAVPQRRVAALVIFTAASCVAAVLLWSFYLLNISDFISGIRHAHWLDIAPQMLLLPVVFRLTATFFLRDMPVPSLMLFITFATYIAWRRTRFFGTAAPLLTLLVLLLLAFVTPQGTSIILLYVSLPFLFVFISGVFADLLESNQRVIALGLTLGTITAHAIFSILGLIQLTRPH